jgi:hypothetical protein
MVNEKTSNVANQLFILSFPPESKYATIRKSRDIKTPENKINANGITLNLYFNISEDRTCFMIYPHLFGS